MRGWLVIGVLLLAFLAGCAVGPDFSRPKPPEAANKYTKGELPPQTVEAGGKVQHFQEAAEVAADWWRLFGNADLNSIIEAAVAGNQDLKAAQARLSQSQHLLRAFSGVLYPQVDAGFDAYRQKITSARFGTSSPGTIFNLFTLAGTVSYTVDVFGGLRRTVESQAAQVDFQRYEELATYYTLLGNVFNAVVAEALFQEQIEATQQIIGFVQEQLKLVKAQEEAGTVAFSSVLAIQSQLEIYEANLPVSQQNLSQAQHLLSTLIGIAPSQWSFPSIHLTDLTLPAELPISLPSALVRQRPDILAAEAQLHSTSAQIGVATAALFPSLTLSGSYGQDSNKIDHLFDYASNVGSMNATLTAPLFHGGTLWFQRKAAKDAYDAALADYQQTILSAFAQTADVLRAIEHDAEALRAQSSAVETASQALRILQASFKAGSVDYTQVLVGDTQYQQARIGYIQTQALRFQDTAALFVALGGGWWNCPEEMKKD